MIFVFSQSIISASDFVYIVQIEDERRGKPQRFDITLPAVFLRRSAITEVS